MGKFQPGQARPAKAGRKKGTPNKVTADIIQVLKDMGHEPAAVHVELFREAMRSYQEKIKNKNTWGAGAAFSEARQANADLMKYVYPVRKAVEHTGAGGGPLEFKTYNDIVKALGGKDESKPE